MNPLRKPLRRATIALHDPEVRVKAAVLLYTLALTLYTVAKHRCFQTYAWDLGIYSQALYTASHRGQVFVYTCEEYLTESGSFFGVHFSPILFLILPIYRLAPRPEALLALQSLLLGASAYPFFLTAKESIKPGRAATLSICYLLYPALHGVNCYDFHVQAFLPLLVNALNYYTEKQRWTKAVAMTILCLSVQEQVTYLMYGYAAYLIVTRVRQAAPRNGRLATAAIILTVSTLWAVGSASVIHRYNPEPPDYLLAGRHFRVLGVDNPRQVPLHALTHPLQALRALSYDLPQKTGYILSALLPYLMLPLISPAALIPAAPWLTLSLLSNYPPYYRLGFQYTVYLIPFTANAALRAIQRHGEAKVKHVLAASTVTLLMLSPLSPVTGWTSLAPGYEKPMYSQHVNTLHAAVRMIPADASVLTQDNLFPHVSTRTNAYVIYPYIEEDPVVMQEAMRLTFSKNPDYILIDLATDPHGTAEDVLAWINPQEYTSILSVGQVHLFRSARTGAPGEPT